MAAGEHFLSDVAWSALLALGLAHVLYYYILRIPQQDAALSASLPSKRMMALLVILAVIARLPHGERFTTLIKLSNLPRPPQALEITARAVNIDILIGDLPKSQNILTGKLHGLGLFANRLEAATIFRAEPVATLSYRIDQEGWLTDYNALATIRVPAAAVTSIAVRLQHGTIRVIDASADHIVRSGKLQLDLQTRAGSVQRSEAAAPSEMSFNHMVDYNPVHRLCLTVWLSDPYIWTTSFVPWAIPRAAPCCAGWQRANAR